MTGRDEALLALRLKSFDAALNRIHNKQAELEKFVLERLE